MRKKFLCAAVLAISVFSGLGLASCSSKKKESTKKPTTDTPPIVQITSSSVRLDRNYIQLEKGMTARLTASVKEGSIVEWKSYDESVATVENGEVTAWKSGKTTIVATVGFESASCEILVTEPVADKSDYALKISEKEVRIDANKNQAATLTVSATHNGTPKEASVVWSVLGDEEITVSPNGTSATVVAAANGKSAVVLATATVDGVTLTSSCLVYSEAFTYITLKETQTTLYAGECYELAPLAEAWVDDVKKDVAFSYSSSAADVVSVDEDGKLTAQREGTAEIVVSYGRSEARFTVRVNRTVYVSTAKEFLSIDGAAGTKFVLTDDIDLSVYFKLNPTVNAECLIEYFDGILEGNGYCVSGWYRLSSSDDRSFRGIFAELGDNAKIRNFRINAFIDVKNPSALVAENNMGDIENCIFDIGGAKAFPSEGSSLFKMSNGTVKNCIFNVSGTMSSGAKFALSDGGYGSFEACTVIAPVLTSGAYINKSNAVVNENVDGCYYYESLTAFLAKSAYTLEYDGKGGEYSFGSASNYDESVFTVESGNVYLKNEKQKKPVAYAFVTAVGSAQITLGEQWQIVAPETDGEAVVYLVLDGYGVDVTAETLVEGKFAPYRCGSYKLLSYALKGGVYASSLTELRVTAEKPAINEMAITLKEGEKFTLAVAGLSSGEFNYYSKNESVASVDDTGNISAVAEGDCYVLAVKKDGSLSYSVKLTVVAKTYTYVEVADKASLLDALKNSDKNTYIALTADIVFEESDMIKGGKNADEDSEPVAIAKLPVDGALKTWECYYRYIHRTFDGTINGRGHKITVKYSGDGDDIMCGMFLKLGKTSRIENLYYFFDGEYEQTKGVSFTSTFARTCLGSIDSCYMEADLKLLGKTVENQEGVIGYLQDRENSDLDLDTANCYYTVFNIRVTKDGEPQDLGYAVRVGLNEPHAYDCVTIRNGVKTDFYGDFNNGASGIRCADCYHYRTVYDFIHGLSGNYDSIEHIQTPVSDGQKVYADWGGEWQISDEGVYFFGRKVADCVFEAYNQPLEMPVSEQYGTISWSLEGQTEVYVNGVLAASTKNKSFALSEYLFATYGETTAKYNVFVKGEKQSAVIVYEMIALNTANFYSSVSGIKSEKESAFKYYFLVENVDLSAHAKANFHAGAWCAFVNVYTDLDGRGHAICFNYTHTDGNYHGLASAFMNVTWKNVALRINLSLAESTRANGVIAYQLSGSTFENCYVEATLDNKSNKNVAFSSAILGGTTFKNCLLVLNDMNKEDAYAFILAGAESHSSFYRSSAIVCSITPQELYGEKFNLMTVSNCYQYETLSDFIEGKDGLLVELNNSQYTITGTAEKAYSDWNDAWAVSEDTVMLCGEQVRLVVKVGDNDVSDPEIS